MLKPFLHQYVMMLKHVQDGLLLVHPLVLEEPATLRASTSMIMTSTKPSVMRPNDRCPPAASPRSSTLLPRSLGWRGALEHPLTHDLSSSRIHSRRILPIALASALPPVSAHVGYNGSRRRERLLTRPIADSNGNSPGKVDTGICWGKCSTPKAPSTPTI